MSVVKSLPELLLIHGWALGPGMWRPMLRHLSDWGVHALDMGYFGPSRMQPDLSGEGPLVAVGHSLGSLWLLRELALETPLAQALVRRRAKLVLINGFGRFSRAEDFSSGVHPRILERMIRRLRQDPAAVLDAFRVQAGAPPLGEAVPKGANIQHLEAGLQGLLAWDGRPMLESWPHSLLALSTQDDGVATPAMTRQSLPESAIHWRDQGGHMLPLSQPAWCAEWIRQI
ncbi:MAG: alpha/beta fold hydrolase [Magnetococcales bacterium]|nr:alpha/beta fold hydrolase [Magnetococcales bacterium]